MSSLIEWREKSETDLASSDGSASEDSGPAEIEPTKSHTLKQELLIYLYTKDCPDRTRKDGGPGGPGVGKSGTSEAGNSKLMVLTNQIKSQ